MDNDQRANHSRVGCNGVTLLLVGLGTLTVQPAGPWILFPVAFVVIGTVMIVWHLITVRAHEQQCPKCGRPIHMRSLMLYNPRPNQLCRECRALDRHST